MLPGHLSLGFLELRMKKKNATPLPLRVIPRLFPWLERFAPWLVNRLFVYMFYTPFRYKRPEKELDAFNSAEKFSMLMDGKKIQCYSWGSGPVVLLVHGWAGRGTQLRKFIEPLNRAGYRAFAMDGPAHGASDGKRTTPDEFGRAIMKIEEKVGGLSAIIAHSFGGVASLNAIAAGLPLKTLINIASPTIGEEIIKTYLQVLNGSEKTGEAFKQRVLKKTGKSFHEFTALALVKRVPADLNLLLVHDEGDKEVSIRHPQALLEQFPRGKLLQTKGLGHNRILKDEDVIRQVVTFIQHHSSN